MVTEVNKIAADALAREHALHLPGVGSLVVERRPAERLSSRRMRRAYLAVTFTSQQRGVSLVARIAAVAAVDIARAQDIYDRWLAKCGGGPTLVIEGVGRLDRKSFLVEEVFDRVLNPAGRGEVAVGRYSRHIFGAVVAGVCIAVLAVTLGIGLYYTGFGDMMADMSGIFSRTERVRSAAGEAIVADNGSAAAGLPDGAADEMPAADTTEAADADKRVDTVPGGASERPAAEQLPQSSQTEQPVRDVRPAAVAESQAEDAVGRLSSGCSYVVLGVFSTPENAVRAVAEARAKHGVEGGGAFVYGPKYLAALYFDMDRERCAEYARSATQFSDLWIYTAR